MWGGTEHSYSTVIVWIPFVYTEIVLPSEVYILNCGAETLPTSRIKVIGNIH